MLITMKVVLASRVEAVAPKPTSLNRSRIHSMPSLNTPSWAPSKVVVPIEAMITATEPGTGHPAGRTGKEPAKAEDAVAELELAERTEHAEVDREGLAVPEEGLAAERGGHAEGVDRIGDRGPGDDLRLEADRHAVAFAVDQFEPDEADQPDRGRPAAQLLRIDEMGRRPAEAFR